MSEIQVSIVIPHKDSWSSLSELLCTIPQKNSLEVIVVDDHSSTFFDENKIKHPNLIFLHNEQNHFGAGAARNLGIEHARGDWLLFADSDDTFVSGAFDVVENYIDSPFDVIYFPPTSINEGTDRLSNRHTSYAALVDEYCNLGKEWIRFRFHPPWSKMIRRKFILKNRIDFDETPVANDLVFSLKVGIASKRVTAVQRTIYCVTNNKAKGLSNRRGKEDLDVRFTNHVRYNEILKNNGLGDCQMSTLSLLRKAFDVSFLRLIIMVGKVVVYRQPFFDNREYRELVKKRTKLETFSRRKN